MSIETKRGNQVKSKGWVNCGEGLVPQTVLVEDDSQVRGIWLTVAIRLKLRFATYSCPEEFLPDLKLFNSDTEFYLDQDFGKNRGQGMKLAQVLRREDYTKIHLVTSYPRDLFLAELKSGLIVDVFSKFPWPFTALNAVCPDRVDSNSTDRTGEMGRSL